MAIRIFEMDNLGRFGNIPAMNVPFDVIQTPGTVGATSVQSTAFQNPIVIVQSDEACHISFGANPTATTSNYKLAAGAEQAFTTEVGHKVAWIQA